MGILQDPVQAFILRKDWKQPQLTNNRHCSVLDVMDAIHRAFLKMNDHTVRKESMISPADSFVIIWALEDGQIPCRKLMV